MAASLETLVIAAYVFAESLPIPRSESAGKATDAQLIALAVAQAALGIPSERQFLGCLGASCRVVPRAAGASRRSNCGCAAFDHPSPFDRPCLCLRPSASGIGSAR